MQVYIWLAILVFLLFVEGTTLNLVTIWFAGGALAAAIAALLKAETLVQLLIFIVVSLLLLVITRPFVVKFMERNRTKTNVDSLIGRSAVVTEKIDNLAQTGHVMINDIDWMARTSSDGTIIPAGAIVIIEEVKGVRLIVKATGEERKEVL